MQCTQIVKSSVECVSPSDTAEAAAQLMRDHGVDFLPVCDHKLQLLGTLTAEDLATRLVAEGRPWSTPVAAIMTREVVACSSRETVERVEELMELFDVESILCTDDDGTLIGLISLSDVAANSVAPPTSRRPGGVS